MSDSPTERRVGALVGALVVTLCLVADAVAQTESAGAAERRIAPVVDHSSSPSALPPLDPNQWTREQLGRIDFLESQIVCRCPKENWSKTLDACPDACADEQKRMVREGVRAGASDDAIFKAQLELASTRRVLADPGRAGASTNFLLIAIVLVVVAGSIGFIVVRGWTRNGAAGHGSGADSDGGSADDGSDVTDEEIARVERELEGLR